MANNTNNRPQGGPGTRQHMTMQKPKNVKRTIKSLWQYLSRRKFLLIFAFIMVVIKIAADLMGTSLLQPIIDNFLQPISSGITVSERIAGLAKGALVILAVYVLSVVAAYFQNRLMVNLTQNTINEIRKDLFDHLQDLSVRYFDTHSHGEMMSRFTNDVDTLNEALQNSLVTLFSSAVTVVGIIAIMISKSWVLTLITLVMTPVIIMAARKIIGMSSKYFVAQQKNLGAVNGYVEEIITGQKVVKVFNHEENAVKEFAELNERLRETATIAQGYAGMMMPVTRNLNNINYALVAAVGGLLTILGHMSVGSLVVFLQFVSQIGKPINETSNQYNAIITAISGAERIFDVMNEKPEEKEDEDKVFVLTRDENKEYFWKYKDEIIPVKGDVRFNNVTFGYNEDKTILKDISLYAKPGQKIAFVGSTGAGKTTIINLLTRFYDIKEGHITVDGIPLKEISKDSLRKSMSVVLQDTHLFTGTVMENIRYGRMDATEEEIIEATKLASAHSFISRLPKGYDTMIEGDGANLSQGQRQLLNIARAAVADAPILILDEATSSVDTRTERHIEIGLDRLMKNRTTFVIAHRLSTVRNSNAIMVMEQGEIIERGTHEDLLDTKGRYYELYTGVVELD